MADFAIHMLASVALILLGLWHLLCAFKSYLKNPNNYTAKPWHPITAKFKTLELYLHLGGILVAMVYYLAISSDFDPLVKGSTPVYRLITLQTAAVLAVFLVSVLAILASENIASLVLPPGFPFLAAALGFGLQSAVLNSGAALTSGIEGKCESLLGKVAGVCCLCAVLLVFQPRLLAADLGLSSAVLLQGLWFLQSGLSLHVRGFMPAGCDRLLDVSGEVEGSTQCDLDESRLRALALLDLLFIVHVIVVILVDVTVCGLVARVSGVRKQGTGDYEPLSNNISLNSIHKVQE
uniref:TSA: Wollemia nobilis Ref_Wollemi_Transcript_5071_1289 transcribed RNA sequence n=1 Tax=Wollemia nobilis TaxID=56998 RepID=A0A0C9RXV5_9CONI